MSAPVDRLPFPTRMRALAEHALSLSETEYRSVHRELDAGDPYHRHLALHYAAVRRDIPEVVRALRDPVLRRRALSAAMRLPAPDAALVELVETAPRRDRLLVYGLLRRSRRRALADSLLPKVFDRRGRVEASRLLPACSPAVIDEWLPRTGADLSVRRQLVRAAPKAVLTLISSELAGGQQKQHADLLEALVAREPGPVGELVARHPHLCRTARLALAARASTSDFKVLWRYLRSSERAKVLAALPVEQRRELIDAHSTPDEIATLPVEERREHVADRPSLFAALPFAEVSERLLKATTAGGPRSRASAWHDFLACARRTGDPQVMASAVAYADRAWYDQDMVRGAVLEQLATVPKPLLAAVPTVCWQSMTRVVASALGSSRRTRRAFRRVVGRLGTMTEREAVELVVRDPRNGRRPDVWAIVAGRRTDLVDAVLDAGWPGPTHRAGRWNPAQRARYEELAARIAMDDAVAMSVRVKAAGMIRDQNVLAYLVDCAPLPLGLAAIRGVTAEQVLVRCVEASKGPISAEAARVLAGLLDSQPNVMTAGGMKEQARLLAETRTPEAVDRLLELWHGNNPDVRAVAAASLVTFLGEDPRVPAVITEAMADGDHTIRQAVLGRPAVGLTPEQSVLLTRLMVEAIRHGQPDVIRAYGKRWRLAPDGFDHLVAWASGDADLADVVLDAVAEAANTETGERAALSVLDRIVDARGWLAHWQRIERTNRSERVTRRLVDALLQAELMRPAVAVLYQIAVRTLDLTWWRELVAVVGDRADRLGERMRGRPEPWNEDAAVEILGFLADVGGYAATRLALRLVNTGGTAAGWTPPWRARLEEFQTHHDIDIRELATAVRVA